jgi:hypothetical protein
MNTWQELQTHIDKILGLRSEVLNIYPNSVEVNYISPTGLVLFCLWLTKIENTWEWGGVGNLLADQASVAKLYDLKD